MSAAEPSTSVATTSAASTDSTAPPKRTGSGLAPEFSNQVGGHSGSFAKTITGDIWKLTDEPERYMLELLNQTHDLRHLVPRYSKEIELSRWEGKAPGKDDVCIEMQDVTAEFGEHPCIMDVKVGIRTFLEDEVTNQKIREDLLKKMDKIDKSAATAAERASGGITKLRYMQWREQMSSSATLGFRVEGIKVWAAEEGAAEGSGASQVTEIGKEALSTENDEETVLARLRTFVHNDYKLARLYLERLTAIRSALSASALFMQHQLINTSLLFVHDAGRQRCGIWMIDFSKARASTRRLTHSEPWELGNEEDGYLKGLGHLIRLWTQLTVDPDDKDAA